MVCEFLVETDAFRIERLQVTSAARELTGGTELENTTGDPRLDRDPTPDRPVDR